MRSKSKTANINYKRTTKTRQTRQTLRQYLLAHCFFTHLTDTCYNIIHSYTSKMFALPKCSFY